MEFRVKTLFTKQYRMKIALTVVIQSTCTFTFPMKLITCISSENDHIENIVYLSLFFFCSVFQEIKSIGFIGR